MRIVLAFLALLLALSPGALAHLPHGPCSTSKTIVNGALVHVDVFTGSCTGAAVTVPPAVCAFNEVHVVRGLHTPVLNDWGCETGVIVETLRLLP